MGEREAEGAEMIKVIRELISPDLKGNKWWLYAEKDEKTECAFCHKYEYRGMDNRESGEFWCAKCYIKEKGSELKVTLPKRKLALYIAGVTIFVLIQVSIIGYFAYLRYAHNGIDQSTREFLIETFYPLSDKRMDKDAFIAVVDTILEYSEMPELAFAIIYNESLFYPGAVSSTGARGLHQIISQPGWVPELTKNGVIEDIRGLHGVKSGVEAGNYVLNKKLAAVKGDLPRALMNYYGHKKQSENIAYMQRVLQTYGFIKYSQKARAKSPSWQEVEAKEAGKRGRK